MRILIDPNMERPFIAFVFFRTNHNCSEQKHSVPANSGTAFKSQPERLIDRHLSQNVKIIKSFS